jgi:hypothetical protein
MTTAATGIFVGRAIKSNPDVGPESERTTYVCVLLEGQESRPGVTLCEQDDVEALILDFRDLMNDVSLIERLARLKTDFDPPAGTYQAPMSSAAVRYERLNGGQINKLLRIWD